MRMIGDKEGYIRDIQKYLSAVLKGSGIVFQTGVYDDATRAALKRFKKEKGMSEDEVVDRETFELLYSSYCSLNDEAVTTLRRGDSGDEVLKLNTMLRSVAANYSEVTRPRGSAYFSDVTALSVRALRARFMMDDSADADGAFISRLQREYALTENKGGMR